MPLEQVLRIDMAHIIYPILEIISPLNSPSIKSYKEWGENIFNTLSRKRKNPPILLSKRIYLQSINKYNGKVFK